MKFGVVENLEVGIEFDVVGDGDVYNFLGCDDFFGFFDLYGGLVLI